MRLLQRISSFVGWLALAAVGVLLTLEATGVIDEEWRTWLADQLAWLADPPVARWVATLLGVGLAIAALVVLLSQFAPARSRTQSVVIDRSEAGSTVVSSPTIYRRIAHELGAVDGVHSVKPTPRGRALAFAVELIDGASARQVSSEAFGALGDDVWASLGIPPRRVDLTLTYRRTPTPVTRKEQRA